jgi:hypothetical protein
MSQTDSADHHPFSVGSKLGCDNGVDVRPYEGNMDRIEKIFEHGRVLLIPVLSVSLPLGEPALGRILHNNSLYIGAHTCWEYTASMGRILRGEHLDKQPG